MEKELQQITLDKKCKKDNQKAMLLQGLILGIGALNEQVKDLKIKVHKLEKEKKGQEELKEICKIQAIQSPPSMESVSVNTRPQSCK